MCVDVWSSVWAVCVDVWGSDGRCVWVVKLCLSSSVCNVHVRVRVRLRHLQYNAMVCGAFYTHHKIITLMTVTKRSKRKRYHKKLP